jgi:uroporphyrinogen decarboxylase
MKRIRAELSSEKGLLGFVGGPLTLYCYAVEGTHSGALESARAGFDDGRFEAFAEKLLEFLPENMALQARAGADTVAILDTCAGEFSPELYRSRVLPILQTLFKRFSVLCPDVPISYYSKGSGPAHWETLVDTPVAYLGIDWNHDLAKVLERWSERFAIQGNIDPHWLFLETPELERRLREVFGRVKALPREMRRGWICGLGHGVLPQTPENHVKLFVKLQREVFGS